MPLLNSLTFLPIYVPDVMHMQHDLGASLEMRAPSTRSTTLIWSERMQEPTLPHFGYYLFLPAIALTVPLHEANGHG